MSVLARPRLVIECAFTTNPFVALDDESIAWVDITGSLELGRGVSIGRRRANELDEPSSGTASLTLNNSDGRFTRLNGSGPYYPYVKAGRLLRIRAVWPESSINLLSRRQAAGGQGDAGDVGWYIPSGTLTLSTGTATATAIGTTTTIKVADADASDMEIGDVLTLKDSLGVLKESTYFSVTGKASAAGTTTMTFTPAAAVVTAIGDVATRGRAQWDTGLQPVAGGRFSAGGTNTSLAGPDAVQVTAGLSYTWSFWTERGATAVSVSPRIQWYDWTGALLSETTGATTALTTALQRLSVTGTAPAGATLARVSVANETVLAGSPSIAYRAGATGAQQSNTKVTVTVPATVQAGDGLLAFVSCSTTETIATPAGWTAVANVTDGTSPYQGRTWLFKAVATSSGTNTSAGKVVTFQGSTFARKVVALEAWSGTDPSDCVHQQNSVAEGTSYVTAHTTPNVTTSVANCWIVSACFDRSSSTTAWTAPDTKRHDVFTTGSPASTGSVADNAAPVVAGVYGTKVFTSNVASDTASMWTVALKPSPASGGSSAMIQVTGLQFEQAGTASAWAYPAAYYTRFVGHVDQWPTQWDGGLWALAPVTATDRTKLLADDTVRAAITEEVLSGGPVTYYPLGEDSGATAAGNTASVVQPSLPIVSAGAVTDEMLEFGSGTGPGTDAQPALQLTPTSGTVGKALRGNLYTPLGGDGVVGITIAGCFASTSVLTGGWNVGGVDDGKGTDGGATGIFDIWGSNLPMLQGHLRLPGLPVDLRPQSNLVYRNGLTHMAVLTATISGGTATATLYVDGVQVATASGATTRSEFPEFNRWNIGVAAFDTPSSFFAGTLSHQIGYNRALSPTEISELWVAAATAFAGDYPGDRAARIAAWKGLLGGDFELGSPTTLAAHPAAGAPLLDAYKLIARSDGGLFFMSRSGAPTLHTRSHRTGAVPLFSVTADQVGSGMTWAEDPTLVGNDGTVKWGTGEDSVRAVDQTSIDDYGRQTFEIDTILQTDVQAADRAAAYLARYKEPISRPSEVVIDALTQPALWEVLLATEIGQKFGITDLPTGAPAPAVDLFIEGVGEEINADAWNFALDCSPAGFDFGLLLDDPVRGLLDSNYVGW